MKAAPRVWEILTRKGRGPLMHYDGRKFSNNGYPKLFTFGRANATARQLLTRFPILRAKGYHVWVRKHDPKRPRENPESPGIQEAARKLEQFSGHDATKVIKARISDQREGLVIGELEEVTYVTKREGINRDRVTRWRHKFSKKSRPLLAVTKDGKQLHIVGGRYEFTEAGIEDR
jgi:hypothetical protein